MRARLVQRQAQVRKKWYTTMVTSRMLKARSLSNTTINNIVGIDAVVRSTQHAEAYFTQKDLHEAVAGRDH